MAFRDLGVNEKNVKPIAEEAYTSGNVIVNTRKSTVEDIIGITIGAINGI